MAALPFERRNEDRTISVGRAGSKQLPNHGWIERRMIGGHEQPSVIWLRVEALVKPVQAGLDRRSHVRCLLRQQERVSARRLGERQQLLYMRTDDDENVFDSRVSERGDAVFQHGPVAERQRQLWPAHASALAGGGDDGERHDLTRMCASGMVRPRFRTAINSATMLIAISGTVCEPMWKPRGA